MQRDAETCPCRAAGVGRAPRCPECPGPRGLGVHAHPGRHPAGAGAALYSQTAREGERGGRPPCVARHGGQETGTLQPPGRDLAGWGKRAGD